jgi:hypothetical protein
VDFAKENPEILEQFNKEYDYDYTQEQLIKSAEAENFKLSPGDNECEFGDQNGTVIGEVYDYALRYGGESKRFIWRFKEMLR